MQKKYQVFISSTFRDLIDERQDTLRHVLDLGHIPAGMELFPASNAEQLQYIKKIIDECDYYILIIGGRYGSIDNEGVSYTEREYEYAIETGKPILAFIHGDPGKISIENSDIDPGIAARLNDFRNRVSRGRLVHFWTNRDNLALAVLKSLTKAFQEIPQVGWIRGSAAATEELLQQINNLRNENDLLKSSSEINKSVQAPISDDIADLEEIYQIPYKVESYYAGDYRTSKTSTPIQWAEIFFAIGPKLFGPQNPSIITSTISSYIKDKSNNDEIGIFVSDETGDRIKIQLLALNLIKSFSHENAQGNPSEMIKITESGKRKLLESMSMKTAR